MELRVERLESEVRLLASRLRILDARLQNKGVTLGDKKGRVRTLRIAGDGNLEVE